jgi:hypothetical protein
LRVYWDLARCAVTDTGPDTTSLVVDAIGLAALLHVTAMRRPPA